METIDTTIMNKDQLAAFNLKRETDERKTAKLEAKQENNKRTRRTKAQMEEAKPAGVRGIAGKDCIDVICRRKIGLDDGEMAEVDEKINIPKEVARKLQKVGAIEVEI